MSARAEMVKTSETRRIVLWSTLIALVLFVVGLAAMLPRAPMELILPDQTVYAHGFSEEKFQQVKQGMSTQQVLDLLGPPLGVIVDTKDARTYEASWPNRPSEFSEVKRWWMDYSKPGCLTDSYYVRSIELSPDGIVISVSREHYTD